MSKIENSSETKNNNLRLLLDLFNSKETNLDPKNGKN